MAMIRKNIDVGAGLTEEQKVMLDEAEELGYMEDEDCPELTEEQVERFARLAQERKKLRICRIA